MDDPDGRTAIDIEIEETFAVSGRGVFVSVRLLNPDPVFTMSETPTLGEVPIERWLDVPRKLDANGMARFDYVIFKLVSPADRVNLQPGQRTVLR